MRHPFCRFIKVDLATNQTWVRGFTCKLVEITNESNDETHTSDSPVVGEVRYEPLASGHDFYVTPIQMNISGEEKASVQVEPIGLAADQLTFRVTAQSNGHLVQSGLLEVPVDTAKVFHVQPRVPFFSQEGKPAVGIEVRVMTQPSD